jgi:hypothetical protein
MSLWEIKRRLVERSGKDSIDITKEYYDKLKEKREKQKIKDEEFALQNEKLFKKIKESKRIAKEIDIEGIRRKYEEELKRKREAHKKEEEKVSEIASKYIESLRK